MTYLIRYNQQTIHFVPLDIWDDDKPDSYNKDKKKIKTVKETKTKNNKKKSK